MASFRGKRKMPEKLRRRWTRVAFGDVVRQVRDNVDPEDTDLDRYIAGEHMDTDDLRIRRWGLIGDGYLGPAFHMRFKPGHVLYGSRRTYLRKVAVADFEGLTANTTFVLESKDPNMLLPELLPFIMQTESFHEHSIKQSKGSVNPYINFSDLIWYQFALPPLEEQQRIVVVLTTCEDAINGLTTVTKNVKEMYRSLLLQEFGSRMKGSSKLTGAQPSGGRGWTWQRVDSLFDLQLGKMSSKKAREGREQAEYIKNNNVLWDRFELNNLPTMSFNASERRKFSLIPGDLLVCEGGEIGRAAIWEDVGREIVFQKALHRLRPCHNNVSPRFFLHYLRYCASSGVLEKIATGTTILHLPRERLASLQLPFPEMVEQESISSSLDEVLNAAARAQERAKDLTVLKSKLIMEVLQK
jgi:type I restriction enzyme, S subunit